MILVTKCPHCQTAFKVTDDQLKLYDGAVRCGVCQQIFNGEEELQTEPPVLNDKPAAAPKKTTPPPPSPQATATKSPLPPKIAAPEKTAFPPPPPSGRAAKEADDMVISLSDADINASSESAALFDALEEELSTISLELGQVTQQLFGNELEEIPEEDEDAVSPEPPVTERGTTGNRTTSPKPPATTATTRFANLSLYPDLGGPVKNTVYSTAPYLDDVAGVAPSTSIEAEVVEPDDPALRRRGNRRPSSPYREPDPLMDPPDRPSPAFFEMLDDDDRNPDPDAGEPDFVRKGRQQKRGGFLSGAFLGLATLALLAIFAIQCLYMFSDRIVVWWPPAEPAVAKACDMFSCPRRLETRISALSIESNELQIIPPLTDKYALSMLLRNSSSAYQSWPHVELTLTDQDKKPIVRRVFTPANYLPDANRIIRGIPPYSEESVRLYLEMKTEHDADYRISLFYP